MGHMHLLVGDLDAARAFYVDLIGFEPMAAMPSALFVAAGGYHHHLGFNTWRGEGAGPAPDGIVGLREWTVELPSAGDVAAVRERLEAAGVPVQPSGRGLLVRDPWGLALRMVGAGA